MNGTMRAWVFHAPESMRLEERPIPAISDEEVLIRVRAAGICGSDAAYYFGRSPLGTPDGKGPLVLGHEISGVVEEVGAAGRSDFAPGDRVTVNPVQQCNACPACMDGRVNVCPHSLTIGVSADGGFAEYLKARRSHVLKIADSVSFEAAALTEPLACATYAFRKLEVRLGDYVAIIGSGSIGLMMVQLARSRGAGKILLAGTRDIPLETARALGADHIVNTARPDSPHYASDLATAVREAGGGKLADRVVVPTSAMPALQQALAVSAAYSTVVYFGLPGPGDVLRVPALAAIEADKTIKFSWLAPLVWPETLAALGSGLVKVEPLVSHRYGFARAEEGIREMATGMPDKIKGMVTID